MKTENEIRLILADYPDSLPSDEELMIAVFMGLQPLIVNEYHKIVGWYRDDPNKWFSLPEYKTWNDLMPVVEKITPIAKEKGQQAWFDIGSSLTIASISQVYKRVIEFIKWYNSQNS